MSSARCSRGLVAMGAQIGAQIRGTLLKLSRKEVSQGTLMDFGARFVVLTDVGTGAEARFGGRVRMWRSGCNGTNSHKFCRSRTSVGMFVY